MATVAVPVRIRTAPHFSQENSHRETSHRGRTFRSSWAFVGATAALRYEPCTQFINVSQRALHIYWQSSAMSHAIHKIVSKRRCQSYFISRRSPHHGISKDSDLCASAHRCPHYAYARLIARVTLKLRMILCQELLCVSNAVSVQRKLFSIAHDDFTESQLLHVSAVKDGLNGRGKEGGMIFYLGE